MIRRAGRLFVGAWVLAAGCTVGPDYRAPTIDPPPAFVSQDVLESLNEGKTGDQPPADWWTGFGDPTLDELVEAGLANNQQLAAAAARLEHARARLNAADAEDALRLDADTNPSIQEEKQFEPVEDSTNTRSLGAGLSLLLPLDVFGRNRRQTEAARAAIDSAEEEIRDLVLVVSADIASEYLALRGNQRQLELLRESVALQEKTLSIVRTRFETGLSPELDVRRAETSVQNLLADIPPLERDLRTSRNRLATLSGEFPGLYEERLATTAPTPVYTATIPAATPLDVLRRRPDIRRAEADLRRAVATIGVEEADLYPSFELSGTLRLSSTITGSAAAVDVLVGSLAGAISQAILDGGARRADIDLAQADAREALADYRQALLDAAEQVESVLAGLRSSSLRQQALEKAVSSSQRSFDQAEILYQQGLISFLDVVDAQRELADAEQELASERTNYATRLAALFRALGTPVTPRDRPREPLPAG